MNNYHYAFRRKGASPHIKALNPFYYLEHFERITRVVEHHYEASFDEQVSNFLRSFSSLSKMEKAAVVRAGSRKHNFLKISELRKFVEIEESDRVSQKLLKDGWFRAPSNGVDTYKYIEECNITELKKVLSSNNISYKSSMRKADLLYLLYSAPSLEMKDCAKVRFAQDVAVRKILYLYFGNAEESLATLASSELGFRRKYRFKASSSRRFSKGDAFRSEFFYSYYSQLFEARTPYWWTQCCPQFRGEAKWPERKTKKAHVEFNSLLVRLAALDHVGGTNAEVVLRNGDGHPSRVRHARILFKQGHHEEAIRRLETVFKDPDDAVEISEAEDLLALRTGRTKVSKKTAELRASRSVSIDDSFRGSVEKGVSSSLAAPGRVVIRAENRLWLQLFGLLFWDHLYGSRSRGIISPFESVPSCLKDGSFFETSRSTIEERLESLFSDRGKETIFRNYVENYGCMNGIFRWSKLGFENIKKILETKEDRVQIILRSLARDFMSERSGFPDLLTIERGLIKFVEVKGEGDTIRPNQMAKIESLRQLGFTVEVVKAEYSLVRNQSYVVVDVETTGGRAASSRVTEIGAVKMMGNRVIGEYQTLLNPCRPIPKKIVKLTGITDAMVRGAPHFSDVAEDFRKFCGDSIFVAHFVRFDYSFIREEYRRIGKKFRMPTLCTCAQSRKHFKGLPSYGLANLSKHFGIELTNHHRALADARAASELLKKINVARIPHGASYSD